MSRSEAGRDQARTRATRRQCPACLRKSALQFASNASAFGFVCRYCGHEIVTQREDLNHNDDKEQQR